MRTYVTISGCVFALVALAHLLRLIYGWAAQVGSFPVPPWMSVVALLVAGALCIWAFALARRARTA